MAELCPLKVGAKVASWPICVTTAMTVRRVFMRVVVFLEVTKYRLQNVIGF